MVTSKSSADHRVLMSTERQKLTQSFRRERSHYSFAVHYITVSKLLDVCSQEPAYPCAKELEHENLSSDVSLWCKHEDAISHCKYKNKNIFF